MDTAPYIDAHGFSHLLQSFGFTTDEGAPDAQKFCQWLDSKGGFVHGTALLGAMFDAKVDALRLAAPERTTLKHLLDFAATPDTGLGCVARPWRAAYLEALQTWHLHSKEPAAVVQCDFRNMANSNDALGRAQVDRLMKLITEQSRAILAGGGSSAQAGVTVVRPGGDEVEFLITGVGGQELRQRVAQMNAACNQFTHALGTVALNPKDTTLPTFLRRSASADVLSLLAYKKHAEDKHNTGFGVGIGLVELPNEPVSLGQLQDQLDTEIKKHKEREGQKRAAANAQIFGGSAQWHPLTPLQVRQMLPRAQIGQVIDQAEAQLGISTQRLTKAAWPDELVLAASVDTSTQDLYSAQKQALQRFKATLTQPDQRRFVDALGLLVNVRDPLTGHKAARMLAGSLEYLRTHSPASLVLAEVELSNLVTLNNVLKTKGANQFIHAVNDQIITPCLQQALGDKFLPARDIYHAGGSRQRLVLRDIPLPEVAKALDGLAQHVEREINQKPLGEVLDTLGLSELRDRLDPQLAQQPCAALLHPKKEQRSVAQGGFTPRRGFEVMYGAMQLEPAISAARNINVLEALKESYEAHPVLLKDQLREKGRLFLHTDSTAWTVGNAQNSTGIVQGIPEQFHQVIVERGQRLGRGRYPALLLEGALLRDVPDVRIQSDGRQSTQVQKGRRERS